MRATGGGLCGRSLRGGAPAGWRRRHRHEQDANSCLRLKPQAYIGLRSRNSLFEYTEWSPGYLRASQFFGVPTTRDGLRPARRPLAAGTEARTMRAVERLNVTTSSSSPALRRARCRSTYSVFPKSGMKSDSGSRPLAGLHWLQYRQGLPRIL